MWGIAAGWRRHRRAAPLVIGVLASVMALVSAFVLRVAFAAYASIAVLVGATVLNVAIRATNDRRREPQSR